MRVLKPAPRSYLALLVASLVLTACGAGADEYPSTADQAITQAPPDEGASLQKVVDLLGVAMYPLNTEPMRSLLAPGHVYDLFVSEVGRKEYERLNLGQAGSRTELPVGTAILRVMRDGSSNAIKKFTVLVKREPEFNPPSNLWFAVYDAYGEVAKSNGQPQEGALTSCTACHLSRPADGYVFGRTEY